MFVIHDNDIKTVPFDKACPIKTPNKKGIKVPRKPSNKDIEKGIVKHPSTEELLRKNKEIYQSVFTNSPVGISIYDETGQCVEANDSIAKNRCKMKKMGCENLNS